MSEAQFLQILPGIIVGASIVVGSIIIARAVASKI
jgi:preprotein translocase subunit Sec61beta